MRVSQIVRKTMLLRVNYIYEKSYTVSKNEGNSGPKKDKNAVKITFAFFSVLCYFENGLHSANQNREFFHVYFYGNNCRVLSSSVLSERRNCIASSTEKTLHKPNIQCVLNV